MAKEPEQSQDEYTDRSYISDEDVSDTSYVSAHSRQHSALQESEQYEGLSDQSGNGNEGWSEECESDFEFSVKQDSPKQKKKKKIRRSQVKMTVFQLVELCRNVEQYECHTSCQSYFPTPKKWYNIAWIGFILLQG